MSTNPVQARVSRKKPTLAENYISRSKQAIPASRELLGNSRIMKLVSVARYRNRSRARAAAARAHSEFDY